MEKRKLQWHPAFGAALRITLKDEMEFLEMQEEYLLSKKPPQIDILIIKKLRDRPVKKAIGKIFRQHNIIEYKACFYQSNTDRVKEIDPEELTITFACSRYPREMLNHLTEVRGIHAENRDKGIYYLIGDAIPMQLLITQELTQEENFWLKNLRIDLKAGREIQNIVAKYEQNRHSKDYAAVMDLITRANWKEMEADRKMCDALRELFAEELKEENEKGMERGIHLAKIIFKLSAQGSSDEEIAEKCDLPLEQVREILE